jgi:SpoVK/Ycf46/Vps4 family AAA+-type ATPase
VNVLDETGIAAEDFAQLARLAISGQQEDVRLFVARMVRKYRGSNGELSERLENLLRAHSPSRSSTPLRKAALPAISEQSLPVDGESRLSLLKRFDDHKDQLRPLLSPQLYDTFQQLIQEREQVARLATLGLHPTKSAIFLGPPGVGKTLTARWLAAQLGLPLYVLDLTTVMSSLLGKTGANIRAALDFAKQTSSVLLLDEIDAIAKRRSDDSDVGELKRLVTVILQEVDEWPSTGLLLAATNYPELIDPALWRRFDLVVEFRLPDLPQIKAAILRFAGPADELLIRWIDVLAFAFHGTSFSDIERTIQRFRRSLALGSHRVDDLVEEFLRARTVQLDKDQRRAFAVLLAEKTKLSQRSISEMTGIARDTIRKHASVTEQKVAPPAKGRR